MSQAKRADGFLGADAGTINGVHHTLSIWQSRDKTLNYLRAGAHLKPMQTFDKIATGKIFGCDTDAPPNWSVVHDLWVERGRIVPSEPKIGH